MTPSLIPEAAPGTKTPRPGVAPSGGAGLGVATVDRDALFAAASDGVLWLLAECRRCGGDLAEPFRDEADRDAWAAKHVTGTGHVVSLSIDKLRELPDLHVTGIVSRDEHGGYRFVCPAGACGVSCGPYPTAGVAIASWRQHPIPAAPS